ncbi:hypothetical protein, partial [Klebsiella pneumoniae]
MMEKEQNQCCQQPLLHQDVSPTTSRVTFSTDKKVLTAEQYRGHCCKVSDEAAFCLIQRPYISKTLLTRR